MLLLDNRTLLTVTALISIGSALALICLWRAQSKHNGSGFWAVGMSSVALGSILISFRGVIPDLVSLVAANSFYILGFQLILRGIRIFVGRPTFVTLDYTLAPISAALLAYFSYIEPNLNIRIAILSTAFVIICSNVVMTFIKEKNTPWRTAGFAVALMFGLFGLIHGVRGVIVFLSPLEQQLMAKSITTTLVFLGGIFMIAGMAITLILFSYAVLESEFRIVSLAVEQSASSIIITNKEGLIHYVNPAFSETTGYRPDELIGKSPSILKPSDRKSGDFARLWESISKGEVWRGEFYNQKKCGELFWEIASVAPVKQRNGEISHFVAIKEDITALKQAEQRIDHMANHDVLTGLPNRKLSMERLCNAIAKAQGNKSNVAVIFVDLDGFKLINDTLGHDAGDVLLKAISEKLSDCVRDIDTVARIGGDEFLITLSNVGGRDTVTDIAERMITYVSSPVHFKEHEIKTTASIGIALYPEHGSSPEELVTQADQAMYKIKRKSKNAYIFADQCYSNERV